MEIHTKQYLRRLILFLIHTFCGSSILLCEGEFSKTNELDLLFLFMFLLRWVNSVKIELLHIHKNMKITLTLSINVGLKMTRAFCN